MTLTYSNPSDYVAHPASTQAVYNFNLLKLFQEVPQPARRVCQTHATDNFAGVLTSSYKNK